MQNRASTPLAAVALLTLSLWTASGGAQAARIKAVATFSILGDMVHQVGGDRVDVVTLVGPDQDVHVYEPTPRDVRALAGADVLVINGLGFDQWLPRAIQAAHFNGRPVVASAGIAPRQIQEGAEARTDPHAWQSLVNGKIYVENIRQGLSAADPDNAPAYAANAARYTAELQALDTDIRARLAALPAGRRRIITSHDAFGYFGAEYGLAFIAPEGISTDSEPSAQDVARIIRQIRADQIPAVFLENIADHRLIDQIAHETGAKAGGTLYSDALSPPDGPAATYLAMMRHNANALLAALAP
jgi:zinc/manganese transport system substrate-binding protein